jgi:hypothetical protein
MQYELGNICAGEADVLVNPDFKEYRVFDFWKAAPMTAQSRQAVEAALAAIRERLASLRGKDA